MLRQMTLGMVSSGSTGYIGQQEIVLPILDIRALPYHFVETAVVGPQMCFFENPHGMVLYQKIGISTFTSFSEYFRAVLSYPIDFISIWFTHLFFGLDLKFPWLYNLQLKPASILYSLTNYSIIFIAIRSLIYREWKTKGWLKNITVLFILLFPCITALVVNMEERYMLPLHMLIYMYGAFNPKIKGWIAEKTRINWRSIAVYVIFIVFCFTLSVRILSALRLTL